MHDLNMYTWFEARELSYKPKHFILVNTPLTDKSIEWIVNTLKGRYCFVTYHEDHLMNDAPSIWMDMYRFPAFEDPAEATLYQLKWS